MSNIDKVEAKIRKIDEELATAKTKLDEWKNKISALEKERENAENLRIVQIVRNTEITPDMLKTILSMQRSKTEPFIATSALPDIIPDNPVKSKKERTLEYEENEENTENE